MSKSKIKKIIEKDVIKYKKETNNFLFTDDNSNWIFDFRNAFMKSKYLLDFSKYFWDKYEKYYPFQVGGLESGAIPLISGILIEGENRGKHLNGFFIRKKRKDSGLGNIIEGELNKEKIIIVDDLINSGKSILKVNKLLNIIGRSIFEVFVFVNFGNNKGNRLLKKNNIKLNYSFTLSDFGLDNFGNSINKFIFHGKFPIIYPNYKILVKLNNPNLFIKAPKSDIIIDNKNIYLGGEGGLFLSICKDTGKINWKFKVDTVVGHKNILSSPLIVKNNIYFGSYDGNVYCLNKNNGKLIWKNIDADWVASSPTYSYKNRLLYIGFELSGIQSKGSLVAININTGKKVWETYFNDNVASSPLYSEKNDVVICGGNDGKLLGVNAINGKILYKLYFKLPIKSGFSFNNNQKEFYFGGFDNHIYCVNTLSGKIKWKFNTNNVNYSKILVVGDNIFVGSLSKYFYHLDKSGRLIKKIRTFGKIFSEPILIDKYIIVFASNDGYIYFYNYKLQINLFVIEHGERIQTKMFYDKLYKHLYVYDSTNTLYKYNIFEYINHDK